MSSPIAAADLAREALKKRQKDPPGPGSARQAHPCRAAPCRAARLAGCLPGAHGPRSALGGGADRLAVCSPDGPRRRLLGPPILPPRGPGRMPVCRRCVLITARQCRGPPRGRNPIDPVREIRRRPPHSREPGGPAGGWRCCEPDTRCPTRAGRRNLSCAAVAAGRWPQGGRCGGRRQPPRARASGVTWGGRSGRAPGPDGPSAGRTSKPKFSPAGRGVRRKL